MTPIIPKSLGTMASLGESSGILPQVTITLDGRRVNIVSTIAQHAPDAWVQIRQLCYEGLLAAHTQILQQGAAGPPLVVIPGLQHNGTS